MFRLEGKSLILYWLATIVPAVIVGVVALRLLANEQDSQRQRAERAVEARSDLVAGGLEATITDVQASMVQRLAQLDQGDRQAALQTLMGDEPLVAGVFHWDPTDDLLWERRRAAGEPTATGAESRDFRRSYGELLSQWRPQEPMLPPGGTADFSDLADTQALQVTNLDRVNDMAQDDQTLQQEIQQGAEGNAWQPSQQGQQRVAVYDFNEESVPQQKIDVPPPSKDGKVDIRSNSIAQNVYKSIEPEQRQYANYGNRRAKVEQIERQLPADAYSGWQPWFTDNRLHVLIWYTPNGYYTVYGVLLDTEALGEHLLQSLPDPSAREIFTIVDASGEELGSRSGEEESDYSPSRLSDYKIQALSESVGQPLHLVEVPLGAALPFWRLRHAAPLGLETAAAARLAMALLLGIFVAAIMAGGTLLIWQARRYQQEARQKTSFVSNVSHELKTPLTSIRMYAELLQAGRVADPERQHRMLDVIMSESDRLGRLVANVLDFSRLEQKRRRYDLETLDLTALTAAVLDAQQPRFEQAGMAVWRELPDVPAWVRADSDALEQVLLNLTENAMKYAAAGAELTVALSIDGKKVRLAVTDRGPGIKPRDRERIFDAFVRLDDSLTATTGGTGLGLSIARRLMRGMGGDLRCDAPAGSGSRFTMSLPLAAAPSGAIGSKPTATADTPQER